MVLCFAALAACGARTTPLPGASSDAIAGSGPSARAGRGGRGHPFSGNSGSSSGGDAGAPGCTVSVLRSVPEDHATNVPLTTGVHAELGCLEPGGALPAPLSLTLGTGGPLVFGYSTVEGPGLDFTAVGTLSLGATYTVQVLANERPLTSFQFTTVEGRWHPPERVTTLRGVEQSFAFSINTQGNGVVAYAEQDANTKFTTISTRFFDVRNGLAASSEVALPAHQSEVRSLRVGLDALQQTALTWVDYNAGQSSLLVALDVGSWGAPQQISSPTSFTLESLGLVVSGSSQRALLWKTNPSGIAGNELLQVSDLNQPSAVPVTVASGVSTAGADLSFGTNGLFVVWDRPSVTARYRQSDGSSWDPPVALGSASEGVTRIAASWGGNALVVFPVSIGSEQTLSARYYTPSSGWGNAERLDTQGNMGTTSVSNADVRLDAAGNGLAIWTTAATDPVSQTDAGTSFNTNQELRSQRYSFGSGWAPTHDALDVGATGEQALALDPAGNGFVVGVTPRGEVRAVRFRAGDWQPSVLLGTVPTTTHAAQPKMLLDSQGRGAAIWQSDQDLILRRFAE